jgi:hypothetical protein
MLTGEDINTQRRRQEDTDLPRLSEQSLDPLLPLPKKGTNQWQGLGVAMARSALCLFVQHKVLEPLISSHKGR